MSFTWQRAIILQKVWVEAEGTINHQTRECRYLAVPPSVTDIASNNTAYSNWLVIDCKSAYFIDILLRLGGAVCRQRQMWPIFGSSILTVCEVTERSVSSCLWRKVEQQSIAVLHSKQCHCSIISVQICSYSHYLCALLPTVHCSTICTKNTTTQSCLTYHYAVTVLQYVQCHHLPNCTATPAGFFQRFITFSPTVYRRWHVWEIR